MADDIESMKEVPYASTIESLIYSILCSRQEIFFVVGMVRRFHYTLDCSQPYYQVP